MVLSIFFSSAMPSELTERNSTKMCHMLGSEPNFKMHVKMQLTWPFQKIGAKTTYFRRFFSTTSQLNAKFNGKYLRKQTRYIDNSGRRWHLRRAPCNVPKFHELPSTHAKNSTGVFTHPAFCFIAKLRTRWSANKTEPNLSNGRE